MVAKAQRSERSVVVWLENDAANDPVHPICVGQSTDHGLSLLKTHFDSVGDARKGISAHAKRELGIPKGQIFFLEPGQHLG